jgi:hypothetical protein
MTGISPVSFVVPSTVTFHEILLFAGYDLGRIPFVFYREKAASIEAADPRYFGAQI